MQGVMVGGLQRRFRYRVLVLPGYWALALLLFVGCGGKSSPKSDADSVARVSLPPTDSLVEPKPQDPVLDRNAVQALVPKGFTLVETDAGSLVATGELNGDGLEDVAMLVESAGEESPISSVVVGYGEANGGFRFGEQTGNLGPEPLHYSDPEMLVIDGQVLTVSYQSMRWGIDLKFRMEKKYGDLRLIGTESTNFGNAMGDGAGSSSTNFLTGIRLGNYQRWDEAKGEAVAIPETKEKVSTDLIPFTGFNDDKIYELQ